MTPQSCPEWGKGASPLYPHANQLSGAGQLRKGQDPVSGGSLSWARPEDQGLSPSLLKGDPGGRAWCPSLGLGVSEARGACSEMRSEPAKGQGVEDAVSLQIST